MKTPSWFLKRNLTARILWPVALVYGLASKIIFKMRLFGKKSSKKPVICIGNIITGGVGKTPVVQEIARHLKNPAVLMRGYKGIKTGKVSATDTAAEVGDEAKMLSHYFDVFVGKDRRLNLPKMQKYGHIIMDDGFQNPTVEKNLSILVFDGRMGIGNGFVLPAGPLRESLRSGVKRADAVIIIGEDRKGLESKILHIKNIPVFFAERKFGKHKFGKKISAFAGIGYPKKFFKSLEELSGKKLAAKFPFPDHHEFTAIDLKKLSAAKGELWTTEKDFARLPANFAKNVKVLKMSVEIEKEFYKWLRLKKL
ncbi:MAG: tetraacyldisaccharide 4'-kinase [Alphaproteobacteria bacterium]|nr:tetraacyldisaccharide 4'-kinase [Alphaproteobacteria bacterium]